MQNLWAIVLLFLSSIYVLSLDYFAYSSRGLEKSIVLPLVIVLFIVYRSSVKSWKTYINHQGKWLLLIAGSVLAQTIVLATGGFQSPFLILIHLFMIGVSFFIGFTAAVIFLLFSFIVIIADLSLNHTLFTFFITNPSTIILQVVSLFTIIPIAYIISQQYHVKAMLTAILEDKVRSDEAILQSLSELIIVTDSELNILSVNDSVEKTLQKSKSELLNTFLFNSLLLKNEKGKLADKQTFFGTDNLPLAADSLFTIVNASKEAEKVTVQIQIMNNLHSKDKQYSFIFSSAQQLNKASEILITTEKARAKYDAMIQALKTILNSTSDKHAYYPLLFTEKIENDLYTVHSLLSTPYQSTSTNIDIAVLCKKLVAQENEFSKSFEVGITFAIENFGQQEVKKLTGENFQIDPEKFTGPFFTLLCDAKNCEIVMTKLLDISVFLASSIPSAQIAVQLKLHKKSIILEIQVPNPNLTHTDLPSLFMPNYANLTNKTNILAGSGLEGYLIKTLSEKMQMPVTATINKNDASKIVFTWVLKKNPEARSKLKQ